MTIACNGGTKHPAAAASPASVGFGRYKPTTAVAASDITRPRGLPAAGSSTTACWCRMSPASAEIMGTASEYVAEPPDPISASFASMLTRCQQFGRPNADRSIGSGTAIQLTLLKPEIITASDSGSGSTRTFIVAPTRGTAIASRCETPALPGQPLPNVV